MDTIHFFFTAFDKVSTVINAGERICNSRKFQLSLNSSLSQKTLMTELQSYEPMPI